MKKSTKVTWQSVSEDGNRFVRETAGKHVLVLGPLTSFDTFTAFIKRRKFAIESAIWLEMRRTQHQNDAEKRRNEALKDFLEDRARREYGS